MEDKKQQEEKAALDYENRISPEGKISGSVRYECPDLKLFNIEKIQNKTVDDIFNSKWKFSYMGEQIQSKKISSKNRMKHREVCEFILQKFKENKLEDIINNEAIIRNANGEVFIQQKKILLPHIKYKYRPITNSNTLLKFISRCLNICIDTKNIPENFLHMNINNKTNSFESVRKSATLHRIHAKLNKNFMQLDYSKAFDMVNWEYLRIVLEDLHLPENVINLIMFLNEKIKLYYKGRLLKRNRSIPQGLPISHIVFGFITIHHYYMIEDMMSVFKLTNEVEYSIKWYVDDIIMYLYGDNYIKNAKLLFLVTKCILEMTGFNISGPKCFSTFDLRCLKINRIEEDTKYLGMAYTRNKYSYVNLIDCEVQAYYGFDLYCFEKNINSMNEIKLKILGKLNYRLSGLYGCDDLNTLEDIKEFLDDIGLKKISNKLSLINLH